eukprot:RCo036553
MNEHQRLKERYKKEHRLLKKYVHEEKVRAQADPQKAIGLLQTSGDTSLCSTLNSTQLSVAPHASAVPFIAYACDVHLPSRPELSMQVQPTGATSFRILHDEKPSHIHGGYRESALLDQLLDVQMGESRGRHCIVCWEAQVRQLLRQESGVVDSLLVRCRDMEQSILWYRMAQESAETELEVERLAFEAELERERSLSVVSGGLLAHQLSHETRVGLENLKSDDAACSPESSCQLEQIDCQHMRAKPSQQLALGTNFTTCYPQLIQNEHEKLRKLLREKDAHLQQLLSEKELLRTDNQRNIESFKLLQLEHQRSTVSLESTRSELERLKQEYEEKHRDHTAAVEVEERLGAELQMSRMQVEAVQKECAALQFKVQEKEADARCFVEEQEKVRQCFESELRQLRESLDTVQGREDRARQECEASTARSMELSAELSKAQQHATSLQAQLASSGEEMQRLRESLAQLELERKEFSEAEK